MDAQSDPRASKTLVAFSAVTVALSAVALILLPGTTRGLWSSSTFLPHAYCYLYNKQLLILHLVCDTAIWLAYVAIATTLAYLVYRTRRQVPFHWMFLAFGTFIITCGFTHFMEVVVLWHPLYWLSGDVKLVTAVASVLTAVALPSLVPQAEGMVASAQISEQRRAQLERANADLAKREAQLSSSNTALQAEIASRQRAEESLRELSGRLMTMQDDERQRVSYSLHEGIAQNLVALRMDIESLRAKLTAPGDIDLLARTEDLAKNILQEIRATSYLLHPPLLQEAGLAPALQWYADMFSKLTGIDVPIAVSGTIGRLASEVEIGLFRIAQEGLTNVHLHAKATRAAVQVQRSGSRLTLTIRDNGVGLPADPEALDHKGVGISGIRERARQLHATLEIAQQNPGTLLRVELPV